LTLGNKKKATAFTGDRFKSSIGISLFFKVKRLFSG